MSEPNLYNVGYDVGFEDGFKEAQARINELEAENKNLRYMIIDQIEGAGDDPEIMAASRAEWAARAKAAEAKLRKCVGALGDISNGEPEWPDDPQKELDWCRNRATTTLAELTGGKDE